MICINKRCRKEIGDFKYCPYCGQNQKELKKNKKRANGTGSVYKRKDNKKKPYTSSSSITGARISLGTFETKQEALQALAKYEAKYDKIDLEYGLVTVQYIYYRYILKDIEQLSESSKKNYLFAWNRLQPIHKINIVDLKTQQIQDVIDVYLSEHQQMNMKGELLYIGSRGEKTTKNTGVPKMVKPLSKGTVKQMVILLGKIYKTALANDWAMKDYSEYVSYSHNTRGNSTDSNRSRFSDVQLEYLFKSLNSDIGTDNYIDYIICMCYLNFRVTEFLSITPNQFHISNDNIPYFQAGMKTEAGTNRIVPVHPKILSIVRNCLSRKGSTVFCDKTNGNALSYNKFRYHFDKNIKALGLSDDYTPHSCRRTFSTRLSASGASETDLIALMGHTSIEVDRKHYINQEVKTLYNSLTKME